MSCKKIKGVVFFETPYVDIKQLSVVAARHFLTGRSLITSSLVNRLDCKGNYSGASNNTKLIHWPLIGGLLHWYSEEELGRAKRAVAPPSPFLAVPGPCGSRVLLLIE